MTQVNTIHRDFDPIDDSYDAMRLVPFEISTIFTRGCALWDEALFRRVVVGNKPFYAETSSVELLKDKIKRGDVLITEKTNATLTNIGSFLSAFADGFYIGYAQYDDKVKGSTALFDKDPSAIVSRVFRTIITPIAGLASYGGLEINGQWHHTLEKMILRDEGIKTGEKYKAWYFVINNPTYFVDLFKQEEAFIGTYRRLAEMDKEQGDFAAGSYARLKNLLAEIDQSAANKGSKNLPKWEDQIDFRMMNRFVEIEAKIVKDGKFKGKNGLLNKAAVAAFCEILWEKKYLNESKNRIKTCSAFARAKYSGLDIAAALKGGPKQKSRETHKGFIKGYFE